MGIKKLNYDCVFQNQMMRLVCHLKIFIQNHLVLERISRWKPGQLMVDGEVDGYIVIIKIFWR